MAAAPIVALTYYVDVFTALLDQKKMKAKEEKSLLHVIITHASTTKNIIEISDNSTF